MRNSIRYPFVLVTGDIKILTALVNFIKGVHDSFIRHQVKGVVFLVLRMAFNVPEIPAFIGNHVRSGPLLVERMLTLAEQVRRDPNGDPPQRLY